MSNIHLDLISRGPIDIPRDAPVVLSVVRNEALRLPYWLSYYRGLGFDRFIVVDNASTDGTGALLLAQPDVMLFHTDAPFGAPPGAGLSWKHALLDRFCDGRWALVVDADELLVWPGSETQNIAALTEKLDTCGAKVFFTLMLDMYSDRPFGEIGYRAGAPFLDYAPFFDRAPYLQQPSDHCPFFENWGGVRARLFLAAGEDVGHPPAISKVPLLRWHAGQNFLHAQHALLTPLPLAPIRGALLHFEMLDDLPGKCARTREHEQYYEQGREYRALGEAIRNAPAKSFYDPDISVRYEGTNQLVALKLMAVPALRLTP